MNGMYVMIDAWSFPLYEVLMQPSKRSLAVGMYHALQPFRDYTAEEVPERKSIVSK